MRLKRVDGAVDAGAAAAVFVRLPDSCACLKSKSVTHRIGCAGSFTSVAEIIRMEKTGFSSVFARLAEMKTHYSSFQLKNRCLRARG